MVPLVPLLVQLFCFALVQFGSIVVQELLNQSEPKLNQTNSTNTKPNYTQTEIKLNQYYWFNLGSVFRSVWFNSGSVWFRFGLLLFQVWFNVGSVLVQFGQFGSAFS